MVEDLRFIGRVIVDTAMPIKMVVSDIGDRRAIQLKRIGEMQLERTELNTQHIICRIDCGMGHRFADIADSRCGQTASRQHLRSHFRSGGLAIGTGDANPLRRMPSGIAIHPQLPGKLDLAHHRNATTLRFENERGPRIEYRRSHHQVDMIPINVVERVQIGIRLLLIHAQHLFGAGTQHLHHALARNSKTRHNRGLTAHIHIHHPSIVRTSYALISQSYCVHSQRQQTEHRLSQAGTGNPIAIEKHQGDQHEQRSIIQKRITTLTSGHPFNSK